MHPAFSVIFLTTLLGIGQGMFVALVLVQLLSVFGLVAQPLDAEFYSTGGIIIMVLVGLALFASFFHLGRPERAA